MTAAERLRAKLVLAYPAVQAAAERLWSGPDARARYPEFLATMHTIVRSAVPLLEAALDQARRRAPLDAVAAGLVDYLTRHVGEETGHDGWLLQDLRATGADPHEPLTRVPSASVASLVGAQYYWLRHYHPVALLGHLAAIEGHPPPVGFAQRLAEWTGYPMTAFRSIAVHAQLDLRHRHDLYQLIDALPLDADHERVIGRSALHTMRYTLDVLDEIAATDLTRTVAPVAS